jgi:dienelactone hydrolase
MNSPLRSITITIIFLATLIPSTMAHYIPPQPTITHPAITQTNVTFTSRTYTLYGEIYSPGSIPNPRPAIIVLEGSAGYTSAYSWIPRALAEHGYITFLFDFPGQGYSEGLHPIHSFYLPKLNLYLRPGSFHEADIHYQNGDDIQATQDALSYLLDQSPMTGMINDSSIGLIGHSLGGLVVTETASQDHRFKAAVALSHATPDCLQNVTIPLQLIGGNLDLTPASGSIPILKESYTTAHPPKELIFIKDGTHLGFTSALGALCPCPDWQKTCCLHYAISWFDWFLKGEHNAYTNITTGSSYLSKGLQSRYNLGYGEHILN